MKKYFSPHILRVQISRRTRFRSSLTTETNRHIHFLTFDAEELRHRFSMLVIFHIDAVRNFVVVAAERGEEAGIVGFGDGKALCVIPFGSWFITSLNRTFDSVFFLDELFNLYFLPCSAPH